MQKVKLKLRCGAIHLRMDIETLELHMRSPMKTNKEQKIMAASASAMSSNKMTIRNKERGSYCFLM